MDTTTLTYIIWVVEALVVLAFLSGMFKIIWLLQDIRLELRMANESK